MKRGAGALAAAAAWLVVSAATAGAMPLAAVEDAQIECLALNVYFEARSESLAGQLAVAHTTLNRVDDLGFPNTICGVVKEGGEARRSCQFSWWCDGKSDRVRDEDAWRRSLAIARGALRDRARDPTGGALYFHNVAVRPAWARHRELTARIGTHLFYR